MNINADTRLYCLIGDPVSNSLSPDIHNYLFDRENINGVYMCNRIEKENLKRFIDAVKLMDIGGFNVTIPHKVDIMEFLDEIDENAKIIGAVNTVKNIGGILKGYNTDGTGFVKAIKDRGYEIKGKKIIILGAGGACRSIAVELASEGAGHIELRNRSIEKAQIIKDILDVNFEISVSISSESVSKEDIENADFLINTTSVGMESDDCPVDAGISVSSDTVVYDIVYKPHCTEFIKWAEKNSLDTIYGIEMLINQGITAFEIWNECIIDKETAKELREMIVNKSRNKYKNNI